MSPSLFEHSDDQDRLEIFSDLANQVAREQVIQSPLLLPKLQRRDHIRQTLREDHKFRIRNNPEGAQAKFRKLAEEVFSFFRGTALLYYRDYAGIDNHLPVVFTVGDAHPENFGVMPNRENRPFFGVNDFDEAIFAPFTFDVKRGAVGFDLAARVNGCNGRETKRIIRSWVEGYVAGLKEFARDDRECWFQFRLDNSPELIRKLIEDSFRDRLEFLEDKIDLARSQFLATDEIVPVSRRIGEFQDIIDRYRGDNGIGGDDLNYGFFDVLDVAIKKGSGLASLGLERYWVLLRGQSDMYRDNLILEMKQARRSALYGLVPARKGDGIENADHAVAAHLVHLAGGDRFFGKAEIDGKSFVVRERSPFKNGMDIDNLQPQDFRDYARICGNALAQTHARSDEDTGLRKGNVEKEILGAIDEAVFLADILQFAKAASRRIRRDWKMYCSDFGRGVFSFGEKKSG